MDRRRWLEVAAFVAVVAIAVAVTAGVVASSAPPAGPKDIGEIAAPIIVQHGGWKCTGPQDGTVVIVQDPVDKHGDPLSAAVNLTDGCTGTIGAIIVQGNQRDGIKIGGTARDVEVLSGWIQCGPRAGDVHQDGVQAGGGTSVHVHQLHVDCPTSNNSSFFVNQTNGGSGIRPTDITCTGCDLLSANNALNVGEDSTGSGARNSILRKGTGNSAPANCARVNGTDPINADNVCVDPNPAIDTGQPVNP